MRMRSRKYRIEPWLRIEFPMYPGDDSLMGVLFAKLDPVRLITGFPRVCRARVAMSRLLPSVSVVRATNNLLFGYISTLRLWCFDSRVLAKYRIVLSPLRPLARPTYCLDHADVKRRPPAVMTKRF